MDDLYRDYVNRVVRMTLSEKYETQVQHIQASAKFRRDDSGTIQPLPFPGYTVMTPSYPDDSENRALYDGLSRFQQDIGDRLPDGILAMVPPDSFHMTLADLIWDSNYRLASESLDFEVKLRDRIHDSFQFYQSRQTPKTQTHWQVLGLLVMARAIAVCLAPKNEDAYERVITLRRAIYQNSTLMALGIEQQYHFTAHITLGYFTNLVTAADKAVLAESFTALNQQWLESDCPQDFCVYRAEFCKFDDMTAYWREPDWPTVQV